MPSGIKLGGRALEIAAHLEATAAPPEAEALYGALQAAIKLFRNLRDTAFRRYGLTLDPKPEGVIMGEIGRLWSARRS